MKTTKTILLTLIGLTLNQMAHAATPKPVVVCKYSDPEPHCTVDLVTAMNGINYRTLDIEGHKLTIIASFRQNIRPSVEPEGLVGDVGGKDVVLPLNPRIQSDLKIIRIKFGPGAASSGRTASLERGNFTECRAAGSDGYTVLPAPQSKDKIDRHEVDFESMSDCSFVVTSVVLALPRGSSAPRDARPKQDYVAKQDPRLGNLFDAGRSMIEHLELARKKLGYLRDVLPNRMKPTADAYRGAVDQVIAALNFAPSNPGNPRPATDVEVYEKSRSLYVHGSVLEAILNKNRSDLTDGYIDSVHDAVAQLAVVFGFNDGSKNLDPKEGLASKNFGGPLSQGYAALMTAVDLALGDAIINLPIDVKSPEMRIMYDVQARAQKIKRMTLEQDDGAVANEIPLLAKDWNEPTFGSALTLLAAAHANAGALTGKLSSVYPLLAAAAGHLASFSGLDYNLPAGTSGR